MSRPVPLTFFLAGFSKCGTTTLSAMLHTHPQIALPSIKEPWFFSSPDFHQRWDWFRSLYPADLSPFTAVGDDSNEYSSYNVCESIAPILLENYPDARFLFLARDPVARIESAYRHFHDDGMKYGLNCPYDLYQAMIEIPSILHNANYWTSISPYRHLVSPDRIMVAHLEDLVDDPSGTLGRIFSFLGVDDGLASNTADAPRLNTAEERHYDTKLMRRIRTYPRTGFRLGKYAYEQQERLARPLRLRRPFPKGHRPDWTPEAIDLVRSQMLPGVTQFASTYGLPRRGWTRLESLIGSGMTAPTDSAN